MPLAGFELTVSAGEGPPIYAFENSAIRSDYNIYSAFGKSLSTFKRSCK
jgi:hypothetical protein